MLVNSINHYSNHYPKFNPAFKSDIIFDIGGSQREGSCKIYYATSENSETLKKENTTVINLVKVNL